MRIEAEVKKDLWFIGIGCAVLSVLTAIGALLIGEGTLSVLLGCIVGGLLSFGNFFFMTIGIIMALETGSEGKAKRMIRNSRIVRTLIQLGVIALSILFPQVIHWLPVILATFFPRILISVRGYWNFFRHRSDPVPESTSEPAEAWEEDEETDGFENFVRHFAKNPDTAENIDNETKK